MQFEANYNSAVTHTSYQSITLSKRIAHITFKSVVMFLL